MSDFSSSYLSVSHRRRLFLCESTMLLNERRILRSFSFHYYTQFLSITSLALYTCITEIIKVDDLNSWF